MRICLGFIGDGAGVITGDEPELLEITRFVASLETF
jgi:hypothetical protein